MFDVAIVGGGPGGTATAIALARAGARVVLLERSRYDTLRYGEMLPPRARVPLRRLGVWEAFLKQGHASSPATVSVWGGDAPHETHFICNPYGHGWHVDRRRFDEGLAIAAEEAGACVRRGTRVVSCQPRGGASWSVEVNGAAGRGTVQADFFIDATGRSSVLARAQHIQRVRHNRLVGIVCVFSDSSRTHEGDRRTLVEAVASGWWYSARLPDSRVVAAYMTDAEIMRTLRSSRLSSCVSPVIVIVVVPGELPVPGDADEAARNEPRNAVEPVPVGCGTASGRIDDPRAFNRRGADRSHLGDDAR